MNADPLTRIILFASTYGLLYSTARGLGIIACSYREKREEERMKPIRIAEQKIQFQGLDELLNPKN